MTGLNIATDVILEIACVITDGNLTVIAEGPSFVIHQSEEKLAAMGKWCQDQHGKTGLIDSRGAKGWDKSSEKTCSTYPQFASG